MRILILTDRSDRHFFFCNRIIEETGQVVGVVTGGKDIRRSKAEEFKRTWMTHLPRTLQKRLFSIAYRKAGRLVKAEKKHAERAAFGGEAQRFAERHSGLHLAEVGPSDRSINDDRFVDLVRSQKPDLILVMGTCLIGRRLIQSAPMVLNMHTGLSPYYRGGRTNFWPFIEADPGNFGVTIHKMSIGIDSGDILYTRRVNVSARDDFATINCKAIKLGTRLMIDAVSQLKDGSARFVPQWSEGKLFFDRDFDFRKAAAYLKMRNNVILETLKLQEQDCVSGITIVDNGSIVRC